MSPRLLHLFGPLYIHAYGLFIALGAVTGITLAVKDTKLRQVITEEHLFSFLSWGILAAVVGGRLLFAFEQWNTLETRWYILELWQPGYSILGTIIATTAFSLWYLHRYSTAPLTVLDRLTIYAPLAQSIARVGCFFTGCCYGVATTVPWAVTYTDPDHLAPLFCSLHPTQLYSSALLLCLFIILYKLGKQTVKPGTLTACYLMVSAAERFFVDFLRADRTMIEEFLSSTQLIAIGIVAAGALFFYQTYYAKRTNESF